MTRKRKRDVVGPVVEPIEPKSISKNMAKRLAAAFHMPESAIVSAARAFNVDEDVITNRIQRLATEQERREFAMRPSNPGGRDGQPLELTHEARVSEAKQADEWASFDTSHPIEKMYRRGSLGGSELQSFGRYRAARVWYQFFIKCQGLGSLGEWLREHVDGSGDPQASIASRMDATMQRVNILDCSGMTYRRFKDLDLVCGAGHRIAEVAKATARDQKTVRESLLSALDVVSGYRLWESHLQAVQVIWVRDNRKKTG